MQQCKSQVIIVIMVIRFIILIFRVDPPTFYPTLEEFSNLTKYIEYMESQGAHR